MRDEPGLCTLEKRGFGFALLVVEGFGLGKPGSPVDRGVQVDVSAPGAALLHTFDFACLRTDTTVDAPITAVNSSNTCSCHA